MHLKIPTSSKFNLHSSHTFQLSTPSPWVSPYQGITHRPCSSGSARVMMCVIYSVSGGTWMCLLASHRLMPAYSAATYPFSLEGSTFTSPTSRSNARWTWSTDPNWVGFSVPRLMLFAHSHYHKLSCTVPSQCLRFTGDVLLRWPSTSLHPSHQSKETNVQNTDFKIFLQYMLTNPDTTLKTVCLLPTLFLHSWQKRCLRR